MKKLQSLTIFFPAFNDEKTLPQLIKNTCEIASKFAGSLEVIVINDGSTDNTKNTLEKLKKRYKNLRVVTHERNLGYGAALQSGFKNARKEWVFYTDGDGQYDPRELKLLVDALTEYTDVVNGYKLTRSDPAIRKILGWLYSWFLHLLYDLPIRDVDCDFRLIRRSFLKKIHLTSTSGTICLELVAKLARANARFKEVGIHHYKRVYGESTFFTIGNLGKTLFDSVHFYLTYKR